MFRKDFLWGSASAAYQVEGAYNIDGKGVSIWDEWVKVPGKTFEGTNGDIAADHYHRYKEDIALMHEQGLRTYRFSISWPRILPQGRGEINQLGIDFYNNVINECLKYNIEPMVTIYHWDLPKTLQDEYDGWESRQIVEDFVEYARVCFENFGDRVKYWIVLNEPNIFTELGYLLAMHPPGKSDMKLKFQTYHHTALVHASVVELFKQQGYPGQIGSSIAYSNGYPASDREEDIEACRRYYETVSNYNMDIYFKGEYPEWGLSYLRAAGLAPDILEGDIELLKAGAEHTDFIGINYYQSNMLAYNPEDGVSLQKLNTSGKKGTAQESGIPGLFKMVLNPNLEHTDWDWVIDPDGLTQSLVEIHQRYGKPLIVSENGLGAFDKVEDGQVHDGYRIDYLKKHILACYFAVQEGVDLLAYCTWSFTDILSWLNGYQKRYGFVHIDFEDDKLPRLKKDSFYFYQEVIETDGESILKKLAVS